MPLEIKARLKRVFPVLVIFVLSATLIGCGPTLKEKKDESAIHYRLGVVHLNERNLTEALKELTRAIEIYPGEPTYHNALGLAYFAKGMNRDATASLKKAISLDPKFSEARVNLSAVYIVEKDYDSAIRESSEALKNIFYRTPEFAHYNIGVARYNKGEYEAALESFNKAAELRPYYAEAFYQMGLTYDRLNKTKESIASFEKAVKVSPGYLDAHYSLGLGLVKARDKAGAMKAFEKVIELAPDSDRARAAREYINLIK